MRNAEPPQKASETIYTAGLDVASTNDTNAFVLYGRNPDGLYDVIPFIWVAEAQVPHRRGDEFDYRSWVKQGLIRTTPGEPVDQEVIVRDIIEICQQYNVQKIAVDRWGTQWLAPKLDSEGLPVVYFGQGYASISEPLKRIERQSLGGELAHGGNPVLRWHVSNVAIERDHADNIKATKSKSRDKIDGLVALAMAVGVYLPLEAPAAPAADPHIFAL